MSLVENRGSNRWLARHYGSRRGFARTVKYQSLYYLGKYRRYRDIDWQSIERLVFVCKGNICRSAFAEAVAKSLGIDSVSCGLETIENAPAEDNSISAASSLGFDLESHKTRPVMYLVLKKSDLIVAMEPWQVEFMEKHLARQHQCTLLGMWTKPVLPHIQDPYGATPFYFERCFTYIERAVTDIARKIEKKSGN